MTFNKVFGIGLSRTGTLSLANALNLLGIPTVHFPQDEATFRQLRSGDFRLQILGEYRGICDIPTVPYYPQFDQAFPGSKFILTTRHQAAWLGSAERLYRSTGKYQALPFNRFINTAVYGTWEFSEQRFAFVYERHLAEAHRYFRDRPHDLLELDICAGEGWPKLAPFLGLPIPDIDFPHKDFLQSDFAKPPG